MKAMTTVLVVVFTLSIELFTPHFAEADKTHPHQAEIIGKELIGRVKPPFDVNCGRSSGSRSKGVSGKGNHSGCAKAYTLSVAKSGSGVGSVASAPAGINCGNVCQAGFKVHTRVTLTATAAPGSAFQGWSGACTGTASTCTVLMRQAKTVSARFATALVGLNVTKTGSGIGTVASSPVGIDCGPACNADFNPYSEVTLTATPTLGSVFSGWSGACTGTAVACTVTMAQAQTVSAGFTPVRVALDLAITGSGAGAVTSTPSGIDCGQACSAEFDQFSEITLSAAAAADSTFEGWSGACSGAASTCVVAMNQAQAVGAEFKMKAMTLSVTKTGSGEGTVTSSPGGIDCGSACSATFSPNTFVTLTATAAQDSIFQGWLGACTGATPSCSITLGQAQAVYAEFSAPAVSAYQYDANGNLTQAADPLGNTRKTQYDSLDQTIRQLEPHPDVPGQTLGQIDADYDALGQLTRITDPRNLETGYQIDALGNLTSQNSPDTGLAQFTYDDAGNVKTKTDARGKMAAYTYDSQNRITQIVDGDQTTVYSWDNCANGIGRLCGLSNNQSNLVFSYDPHGRVTGKSQTIDGITQTVIYRYNASGQLEQTTTSSGQVIGYVRLNGLIEAITINGLPLMTQISYDPDGQINGWTWGNGESSERLYDLAGRPVLIDQGIDAQSQQPDTRHYSYDAAGKVSHILSEVDPKLNQSHDYDGLDRLTRHEQGESGQSSHDYAYDLGDNRTGKIINHSEIETYSVDPGSNRLQGKTGAQQKNYSYDPAGNLTGDGIHAYTYNAQGRRVGATAVGLNATYAYNGLGQRIKKTVNGETTLFFYDDQGHLTGEYDADGQLIQEIVWFGDLPIAVLKPNASQSAQVGLYYIHSDHLATPRQITRPGDNKVLWLWESEAFGDSLPNQDPSGLGEFVFNLRFPGQYYDTETGLHYNYFRDYDANKGGYIQSDPIGLAGGINTYAYVSGNPIMLADPSGKCPLCITAGVIGVVGAAYFREDIGVAIFNLNPRVNSDLERDLIEHYFRGNGGDFSMNSCQWKNYNAALNSGDISYYDQGVGSVPTTPPANGSIDSYDFDPFYAGWRTPANNAMNMGAHILGPILGGGNFNIYKPSGK